MTTLRIPVGPGDHRQGDETAPVTLVEYGDYECPYCGAAYPVVKRLQTTFRANLRFVFRNFPLTKIHANAMSAACVAEFAGETGNFWAAHDALFEKQTRLGQPLYDEIVAHAGLDRAALVTALANKSHEAKILAEFNGGLRSGVNRTPTFFLNGLRFDAVSYKHLSAELGQSIASLIQVA
jgi:protein-disulfide isomerase